jgi:hypothetical protein
MLPRLIQTSFTGGEFSPALGARVDLSKYPTGMKTAINLFIHPHGGASNRAGLEFCGETKDSTKASTLIPFQFGQGSANVGQEYQLEFGDHYMRVWKDGELVLTAPAGPIYELVTPYAAADVSDIVFVQEYDVMYLTHEAYPPQKLSRLGENNWTIAPLTLAAGIATPTGLAVFAHFKRRNGASYNYQIRISAVGPGGAESAGSASSAQVRWMYEVFDGTHLRGEWAAVPGAAYYNVWMNTLSGGPTGGFIGSTSDLFYDFPVGPGAWSGDGTAPGAGDPGAPPTPAAPTLLNVFGQEISYKVSAVSEATGEESLPSSAVTARNELTIQGNTNQLTWTAVVGADAYIVYKLDNGQYGYIGRTETTTFTDDNITADTSDGPKTGKNPFDAVDKYPRCCAFVEQRLAFASSKKEPQGVWLSQTSNYENFGVSSPAKPSDAVTFRIRSQKLNQIRSMIAVRGLMLLTSGSEWLVSGGSQSDSITPSSIKIDNQGYRGASQVQPIVVGNVVLFAQQRGGIIRDFSYQFADDAFVGKDLTILARHLFEYREVKAWAFAQAPYSMAWVVLDDGSLVSLTYMKEQDVWGWTRHKTGENDFFEHVSVIGEGGEDVPYFIVRRTIDGVQKRYVERLHSRDFQVAEDAFFVDCGLTYEGPAATVITGLDHIANMPVVALANGNVVRGLTVSPAGELTLPNATTKCHIGLPYVATMETMNMDIGMTRDKGSVQSRYKQISKVVLRVEKTRGVFVGPFLTDSRNEPDKLVEFKQRSTEAWNEAIRLYTGDIDFEVGWAWDKGGRVCVRQFDPLPMTVLAVMTDVAVGG